MNDLGAFVVAAKAATYVGGGQRLLASRPGSADLQYHDDPYAYHDCYFGGQDFLGQEVVYYQARPIWAMNYYGYLVDASRLDAQIAGRVVKVALTALYVQGRFLGGWRHRVGDLTYVDENAGTLVRFHGIEHIVDVNDVRLYELRYHGGLIRD